MLDRELAEPEGVERTLSPQMVEDRQQAAQVDRVLGEAARAMEPQRDAERAGGGKAAVAVQQPEGLDEVGAVEHRRAADRVRCDEPKPPEGQAADQVLGENGESLLDAF